MPALIHRVERRDRFVVGRDPRDHQPEPRVFLPPRLWAWTIRHRSRPRSALLDERWNAAAGRAAEDGSGANSGLFAAEIGRSAPGGRVSRRRATLLCDCPWRTRINRPITLSFDGLIATRSAAGPASGVGGVETCGGSSGRRPIRWATSPGSEPRSSGGARLEGLGHRAVVDVSDTVQKEHVGAQLSPGGSGFDPSQVMPRMPNSFSADTSAPGELSMRSTTEVRSLRSGPEGHPAGRPGRTGCGRWARPPPPRPGSPDRTGSAASGVLTPASQRPSATSRAAAAFEFAGRTATFGRCSVSQRRTWSRRDRERREGVDLTRLRSGAHDDAECHVQGQFAVDLQRRSGGEAVQGWAERRLRWSSRSVRRHSPRHRPGRPPVRPACSPSVSARVWPSPGMAPFADIRSSADSVNVPSGPR